MVCWDCQGSTMGPDPWAGLSAMGLVGIRHPIKKFETSIKVFSCYEDYWVFPLLGMSRERRQSEISIPL